MPYKPQFGGTNGVPELDLGQEESPRAAADAAYNPNVLVGEPKIGEVENPLTQQNVTVTDHLGFRGRTFRWSGMLRAKDDATLEAIESELHAAKSGQALTAGVPGPFDGTKIKATRLTNKAGRVLSEKAIVKQYTFGRQRNITTGGSAMTIAVPLTIVFEGLG